MSAIVGMIGEAVKFARSNASPTKARNAAR